MAESGPSALMSIQGVDGWKDYFARHELLPYFTELLASLGEEKPAEPFAYVTNFTTKYIRPPPPAHASNAKIANDYFEKHNLKLFLAKLLIEVGNAEPANPYSFMMRYIMQHSDETKSNEQMNKQPEELQTFFANWKNTEVKAVARDRRSTTMEGMTAISLDQMLDWDGDILAMSEPTLLQNFYKIVQLFGCIDEFQLPPTKLKNWIQAVYMGYKKDNPYHSFKHAYSVSCGTANMIHYCFDGARPNGCRLEEDYWNGIEQLSLLMAALCHDVGHEGKNNDFYIKAKHEFAIRYNDAAVLENMHAATAYDLVLQDANNWMEALSKEDYDTMRKIIIIAILNTDMKVHFDLTKGVGALAEQATDGLFSLPIETITSEETRNLFFKAMVHASDISNSVLNEGLAHQWAYLVVTEFHNQAALEKEMGLAFAPFMEPPPSNKVALASLQIGFGQFIVAPFWTPLAKLLTPLQPRVDQLNKNSEYWKKFKADAEEELKKEEA
jgi:hypothetical protein